MHLSSSTLRGRLSTSRIHTSVAPPGHKSGAARAAKGRGSSRAHAFVAAVIAVVAAAVALAAGPLATPAQAALPLDTPFDAVTRNPVESLIDLPLDDLTYDSATHCVKQPTKGAAALVRYLPKLSPRGVNWGINRCEKWGKNSASVHAEGRAIDWHLDVKNAADRADAEQLIRTLLAPDSNGEPFALARRLGVQGLIWDCRSWYGGDSLRRYSACLKKDGKWNPKVDPTTAHRDHVHIELSKAGAKLQTSWWTDGPGKAFRR